MVVYSLVLGTKFQANCYVAENDNKEAFAVDIGGEPQELITFLRQNDLTLKKIFLTHGHYDHFYGVAEVARQTGAEVYIHQEDAQMLGSDLKSLAAFIGNDEFYPVEKYTIVNDGEVIDFCRTPVKVVHTPGHTDGSVCYICEDKMFTGDTLFRLSAGRTDFPGGSQTKLRNSLAILKKLGQDKDYEVYPGHESKTTLSYEIKHNQYMRD